MMNVPIANMNLKTAVNIKIFYKWRRIKNIRLTKGDYISIKNFIKALLLSLLIALIYMIIWKYFNPDEEIKWHSQKKVEISNVVDNYITKPKIMLTNITQNVPKQITFETSQREVISRERSNKFTILEIKNMAKTMVDQNQWECLNELIEKESGWNYKATHRSSGAYGLGQALPASKMSSAGDDWKINPETQLKWLINDYLPNRYGNACNAWKFWQRAHWY